MENNSINVIIADDHPGFRRGLMEMVRTFPEVSHIELAANGTEVLRLLETGPFKLIFLDIRMPGLDGPTTARAIQKQYPQVCMIVVSMMDDIFSIRSMHDAGCSGYLLKNAGEEEIHKAMRLALEGKKYFDPVITEKLLSDRGAGPGHASVTAADVRLIEMICDEKSNKQIAQALGLAVRSVENRRFALYKKIGVNNTAGVVRYAIRSGIIDGDHS